jgi:serine/threonine protein kinase
MLSSMLRLHEAGWAHRDSKPCNVLQLPRLRSGAHRFWLRTSTRCAPYNYSKAATICTSSFEPNHCSWSACPRFPLVLCWPQQAYLFRKDRWRSQSLASPSVRLSAAGHLAFQPPSQVTCHKSALLNVLGRHAYHTLSRCIVARLPGVPDP